LKKLPESVYNRFFGIYPSKTVAHKYTSDAPYKWGTAALGAGAVVAAIALKGATGGGSGGGGGSDDPNPKPDPIDPDNPNCPANSSYNKVTKKCDCNKGYAHHGDNSKCYATIPNCANQVKDICNRCEDTYLLYENRCYKKVENCEIKNRHKSLNDINEPKIGDIYLDVADASSCKGDAVRRFCEILNIDLKDTIAIGDDYNDLSMFKVVGHSVAMGNANDMIKNAADEVTNSNNEDGVAVFLEKII
jgi:hypothetical protein